MQHPTRPTTPVASPGVDWAHQQDRQYKFGSRRSGRSPVEAIEATPWHGWVDNEQRRAKRTVAGADCLKCRTSLDNWPALFCRACLGLA
jgi:hypothetical protein